MQIFPLLRFCKDHNTTYHLNNKELSIQCSGERKSQRFQKRPKRLNSVADHTALADALSDVEPHEHLCAHQAVPHSILGGQNIRTVRDAAFSVGKRFLPSDVHKTQ